jgi:hypothetical protein
LWIYQHIGMDHLTAYYVNQGGGRLGDYSYKTCSSSNDYQISSWLRGEKAFESRLVNQHVRDEVLWRHRPIKFCIGASISWTLNVPVSSVFYPDKNYEPHVEVGGARCGVVLSPYFFTTLVNYLPKLVENFNNMEQYRCVEKTLHLQLIGGKRVILQCDGLCIYLGISDVNFLLCNSNVLQHQLARYIFATPDVRLYVSRSVDSKVSVPPGEGAS